MKNNFPSNLLHREMNGAFPIRTTQLPHIRIKIDTVIPKSALQAGHIILGFSRDSTYILSYTQQHTASSRHEMENYPDDDEMFDISSNQLHSYKLHYWKFIPYKLTSHTPYYSMELFDRNGIPDSNLSLQFCQETTSSKMIVIGCSNSACADSSRRCYVSITEVPRLKKCSSFCSFEAARLTACSEHSLAVSLSYESVPPFPTFYPHLQLFNGYLIINTGNMLHCIALDKHARRRRKIDKVLRVRIYLDQVEERERELNYYGKLVWPEAVGGCSGLVKRGATAGGGASKRIFRGGVDKPLKDLNILKCSSSSIYDKMEEEILIEKSYKTYRKKKLADKRYAFVDEEEDAQNYEPGPGGGGGQSPRQRDSQRDSHPGSLLDSQSARQPGSQRDSQPVSVGSHPPKTLEVTGCERMLERGYSQMVCGSTVSDTNEDEAYPVALPVDVYTESGYLKPVRNSTTADVIVHQTSLDFELLSNEVANFICSLQNINFLFLIDFDPIIIQANEESITCLVFIQIQGHLKAEHHQTSNNRLAAEERKKYESSYLLNWSPTNRAGASQAGPSSSPSARRWSSPMYSGTGRGPQPLGAAGRRLSSPAGPSAVETGRWSHTGPSAAIAGRGATGGRESPPAPAATSGRGSPLPSAATGGLESPHPSAAAAAATCGRRSPPPSDCSCRILYKGRLRECVSLNWNPSKDLLLEEVREEGGVSVLTNRAVTDDWVSLSELTDPQGIVTLYKEQHSNNNSDIESDY